MSALLVAEVQAPVSVPSRPRHLRVITEEEAARLRRQAGSRQRAECEATVQARRGQFVVKAALGAVLATAAFALAVIAGALLGLALGPQVPQSGATVVVSSGDSVWSIASGVAGPGRDVSAVAAEIVALNGLQGPVLQPGQILVLPAR